MKFIRDIDYFLYFVEFPHMGVPGVIAANTDGTVNIYINTLYTPERRDRALRHELRHLAKQHFWCDTKSIEVKELEADEDDPSIIFGDNFSSVEIVEMVPTQTRLPNVFVEAPPRTIPYFNSLDAFRGYMLSMRDQMKAERDAKR